LHIAKHFSSHIEQHGIRFELFGFLAEAAA